VDLFSSEKVKYGCLKSGQVFIRLMRPHDVIVTTLVSSVSTNDNLIITSEIYLYGI